MLLNFHQIREKKPQQQQNTIETWDNTILQYLRVRESTQQHLSSVTWISYPHKAFFSSWSCCPLVSLLYERVAAGNAALCSHPKDSVESKKKWYIHEAHQHKINCLLCKTQSHQNCQKRVLIIVTWRRRKKETSRNNVILHLPATLKWRNLENFKIQHAAALSLTHRDISQRNRSQSALLLCYSAKIES